MKSFLLTCKNLCFSEEEVLFYPSHFPFFVVYNQQVTRQVAQCKCAKRFQVEQIGENKYRVRKRKPDLCGGGSFHVALTGESSLTPRRLGDSTFPLPVLGGPEPGGLKMWSLSCLQIPNVRCPVGLSLVPYIIPPEKQYHIQLTVARTLVPVQEIFQNPLFG